VTLGRRVFAATGLAALLAACGKRGDPGPVGPEAAVTYPRTYPREEGQGPIGEGPTSVFPRSSRGVSGVR